MIDSFFKIDTYHLKHKLVNGGWTKVLVRELFERGDASGVLLYDPQIRSVALLEQFRIGALEEPDGPWLYEIVAGVIEAGHTAEQTAIKECLEETGVVLGELIPIHSYFSSPGGSSEKLHLFCGITSLKGVGGVYGLTTEGEDINVQVVTADVAFKAVAAGHIKNAASIIALQWLQINIDSLQKS
jgi:ADP-ribose pyrophosphatase